MTEVFDSIFEKFGEITFGEINNMGMCDLERCFKKYFSERKENFSTYYDFKGIDNKKVVDFEESLLEYFAVK